MFALALPTFSLSLYGPLAACLALLAALALLGKVPLVYSLRNLKVRWRTTLLTALAFMLVIGLMIVMMAFVDGMSRLTEHSGQPGNVMVLSDGAIDELFSNLKHTDSSDVERQPGVLRDAKNNPLCSRETYLVVTQEPGNSIGGRPKQRFVQLRAIEDPIMSAQIHGIDLYPGGKWFSAAGVQSIEPSPSGRGQGEGDAAKSANPLTPTLSPGEREPAPNELAALVDRLHNNQIPCEPARFASKTPRERGHDFVSSDLININHDSCILCERCMRACDEVKQNFVICRSGKGYTAHIAFDLNNPMGESSCVSCGECMISCPTDALTFKPNRVVMSDWWKEKVDHGSGQEVDALALRNLHPLFSYIPYKFLQWNASAAVKVPVKAGQELCRQGDHGATAFILLGDCKFAILDEARRDVAPETPHQGVVGDILGRFFGGSKPVTSKSGDDKKAENFYRRAPEKDRQAYQQAIAASANGGEIDRKLQSLGELVAVRGSEDLILGEMSCMSYQRRTATIVALGDGEVLEIRRNVLYMLQRNPKAREMLDNAYRERALQVALRSLKAFTAPGAGGPGVASEQFERELYDFLKDKISLVRVDPGQVVFQQGETVTDFFVVRIGYVKVAQKYFGHEKVLTYLGPGRHFGEIGLLSNVDGLQAELGDERLPSEILGKRTATCTALDHVELVRIPGEAFNLIVQTYPHLREHYVSLVRRMLQEGREARVNLNSHLGEYLDQGLFNAQKLLVLDLERCTRCDECTKACADTHGGVTRLKREGLRFGKYLVASACRSCEDPYCLVGCPVDAIHRGEGNEIKIENHCIGCGLCEKNCPYGNIRMWPDPRHMLNPEDYNGERRAATTCDLCVSVIGANTKKDVSCVYSCPHEAAFRMSGAELYSRTAKSAD
jgi:Fe-S-cluster-containing hydrogenase component 2/CRP-like cAMP-binding protein